METKKYFVEYDSNNSGGGWWLKDKDWYALEKAGWNVRWSKDLGSDMIFSGEIKKTGRWLGALAREADIIVETYTSRQAEGIAKEWWSEALPHQNADDEGCSCCGNPHNFYASRICPGCGKHTLYECREANCNVYETLDRT